MKQPTSDHVVSVGTVERGGTRWVELRKGTMVFFVPLAQATDVGRAILAAVGRSS